MLKLLDQTEPEFRSGFTETMLTDPEFREDAVTLFLDRGTNLKEAGKNEAAIAAFQTAFKHAREPGQITTSADRLRSLDQPADIIGHMGFITDWYLVGPFDAPGTSGFQTSYPPETGVDLQDEFEGKDKRAIAWQRHHTNDRLGQVNLNQAIRPTKEAVGYAYTLVHAAKSVSGEL